MRGVLERRKLKLTGRPAVVALSSAQTMLFSRAVHSSHNKAPLENAARALRFGRQIKLQGFFFLSVGLFR